jgi:acetyltransferase
VDLVVLAIPPQFIEGAVREAADHGTRHFVVISAGFKEVGGEGVKREESLKALAHERDLTIVGPNCLGVINTDPTVRMNATFGRSMPRPGSLGLISQSGALCTALLDYAQGIGIGFSRFISFGNKAAVSELDLLKSLSFDPYTKVILMYVEELGSGQQFVDTCYAITHGNNPKPILAIKTGRTSEGAAAAASHTGSLAGSDEVYDAIMTQAGVQRVESVKELFDYAEIFADPILPNGRRTAIITNAGGPGIMATDACIRSGMQLARFQEYTRKSLQYQMPATANIKNPVDVIGDARHDRYRAALDAVTADEGVDQVLVVVTPQTMTDVTEIADVIRESKAFCGKPIVGCLMGLVDVGAGVQLLQNHGVPTYPFPEDAMRAMLAKCRFTEWCRSQSRGYQQFEVDRAAAARVFDDELAAGRNQLVEVKALDVMRHYGFPTVPHKLAASAKEAAAAAEEMGFPVVLKISGPKILHKTDGGGVRRNLTDAAAVRTAHDEMVATVRDKLARTSRSGRAGAEDAAQGQGDHPGHVARSAFRAAVDVRAGWYLYGSPAGRIIPAGAAAAGGSGGDDQEYPLVSVAGGRAGRAAVRRRHDRRVSAAPVAACDGASAHQGTGHQPVAGLCARRRRHGGRCAHHSHGELGMGNWTERYADKVVSAEAAISKIKAGDRVYIGSACGEPQELVRTLSRMGDRLADTELIHVMTLGVAPYADPRYAASFRANAFFIGSSMRGAVNDARADYTPVFLSQVPALFKSGRISIDVALITVSPPDEHGNCSLGVSVDITRSAVEAARLVIAQVNRHSPRTLGDAFLHVSQINHLVPHDEPLLEWPDTGAPDEVTRQLAANLARLVPDGSTLQLGIGACRTPSWPADEQARSGHPHGDVLGRGAEADRGRGYHGQVQDAAQGQDCRQLCGRQPAAVPVPGQQPADRDAAV